MEEKRVKNESKYVFQKEKLGFELKIRELPWTAKQKEIIDLFLNKNTKALFLKGPAGTSKTMLSMYCGLQLLNSKKVSDMILVRSAVESADAKLGFLPGSLEDKISPHITAFNDKFSELLSDAQVKKLAADDRITACPISFARGLHFAVKFVCVDEMQNLTRKEILLMLSRIGEFSKVFLCGDPDQSDLPYGKSGFSEVYDLFDNQESVDMGIHCISLGEEHIVRSEFCRYITKKFKELDTPQKR